MKLTRVRPIESEVHVKASPYRPTMDGAPPAAWERRGQRALMKESCINMEVIQHCNASSHATADNILGLVRRGQVANE